MGTPMVSNMTARQKAHRSKSVNLTLDANLCRVLLGVDECLAGRHPLYRVDESLVGPDVCTRGDAHTRRIDRVLLHARLSSSRMTLAS